MGTKDASDYIRGKWGIELSELAFQRKADEEAQKAFISRQEERFRPAYGREEIRYPRQCVFGAPQIDPTILQMTAEIGGSCLFEPKQ